MPWICVEKNSSMDGWIKVTRTILLYNSWVTDTMCTALENFLPTASLYQAKELCITTKNKTSI